MVKRTPLLLFLVSSFFGMEAQLPYQKENELDIVRVSLLSPDRQVCRVILVSNNETFVDLDEYDAPDINDPQSYFTFWTIVGRERLVGDFRPYETYYIDYSLGMSPKVAGDYTLSVYSRGGKSPASTLLYLFDKTVSDTEPVADLYKKEYTFSVASTAIIENRFFIRMCAAYLSKENYEGNWNDAKFWQSEELPTKEGHVIISSTSTLVIEQGEDVTIGGLTNSGHLQNNGNLHITYGMELLPGD